MKSAHLTALICLWAVVANAQSWKIEKQEEIRQTLKFSNPAAAKEVEVDNVFGAITVTGYDGNEVQLVAHKMIFARSPEKVEEALQDVQLEISEKNNTIQLYVDGPFRCQNCRGRRYSGYEVKFDFELKIPRAADFYLKTVNDGDIKVTDVAGEYEVENVNGGITMLDVSGAGRVYALNEDVKVRFKENPIGSSYFGSLNGDVEISFRRNLSADFRLKTFNGEVYTDFPVTYLANAPPARASYKGKKVYKYDKAARVRVAQGGPELSFDAFNGDIRIIQRQE